VNGVVTITVADVDKELMKYTVVAYLPYPEGVDFTTSTHMKVYDLDDTILYFVNDKPFAAIEFSDFDGEYYTSGKVHDGSGVQVGGFTNRKIPRESNFAFVNRDSTIMIDNFKIYTVYTV
jgi:hypothetical protein